MRILDINDNELQFSEIDLKLGYLKNETILIQHHNMVKPQSAEGYFVPSSYLFTDGSKYIVKDENDPHIEKKDQEKKIFGWINLEGEEPKEVKGFSIKKIITKPAILPKTGWDEYEDIQRYILYTQEELEKIEKQQKQEIFLEEGPDILEDLILTIADIIGIEE